MADSYNKKEREKKRQKRKQNKAEKKRQKKEEGTKPVEFMYVDENGNLSPTPPEISNKQEINAEDIEVSVPKSLDENQNKFQKEGSVKFFNSEKGYGFIRENSTSTDYFVHEDNLMDRIKENDTVVFELGSGPKGPIAINVKLNK